MIKSNKKFGFSLIEISLVMVIIAVLMLAIIKGTDLIDQARLSSARQKTMNSPAWKINGLMFWVEPTLSQSFDTSETLNGAEITNWYNIGNSTKIANNPTQTGSARPTYLSSVINNLPALRFNGSSEYMTYNGTFLANSDYTVFVVEQRRIDNAAQNLMLGGSDASDDANFNLGYAEAGIGDAYLIDQLNNTLTAPVAAYTSPIPRIHALRFSSSFTTPAMLNGRDYYVNGATQTLSCHVGCSITPLITYNGAQIGRFVTLTYYNGDIAEIIMFNRFLSDQERKDVERYLGDKYNIVVP